MKLSTTLVLALSLAACGGDSKPAPTTPAIPEAKATVVFELGEISLLEGDTPMLKIHADGSTEMGYRSGALKVEPGKVASSDSLPVSYKPGPKIQVDGTFVHDGQAVARLDADGTVVNLKTNEKVPGLVITADKIAIEGGGGSIAFNVSAEGAITIVGGNEQAVDKPLRLEGADSPGKRRAMLALVALSLGAGAPQEPVDSKSSSAPAPQ